MTPVSTQSVIEALNWRYATKQFDPGKKIPAATWAALEQALVLAPSSFGLQPWKFVVVQDAAVRERLSAAAWGQRQSVDCSHFVVFCVRKDFSVADVDHYVERVAEVRGGSREALKGYRDIMAGSVDRMRAGGIIDSWTSRQVYIALGQFMAAAAILGVDACPMEGIEPAKFDEILGLAAQGYGSLCACAAGYRSATCKGATQPKVRFKTSEVLTYV